MCQYCWKNAGSPKIWNDRVKKAVELITDVYEFSSVGGNLHCELDDYNLNDAFLEGEFNPYNEDVSEAQLSFEMACFEHLKTMTEEERYSAIAFYDEFWK